MICQNLLSKSNYLALSHLSNLPNSTEIHKKNLGGIKTEIRLILKIFISREFSCKSDEFMKFMFLKSEISAEQSIKLGI